MVDTTPLLPGLSPVGVKAVAARFDGGALSSDAGLLALREVERRLDVAGRLATCVDDPRDPARTQHSVADIVRFRMLMIAAGYEDGSRPPACCAATSPRSRRPPRRAPRPPSFSR